MSPPIFLLFSILPQKWHVLNKGYSCSLSPRMYKRMEQKRSLHPRGCRHVTAKGGAPGSYKPLGLRESFAIVVKLTNPDNHSFPKHKLRRNNKLLLF